jgi:hypothetical protein
MKGNNIMTTVKQYKEGATLPQPIYKHKPYVILSKDGIVVSAGNADIFTQFKMYYDDCIADIRRYDLYLNDNTKVEAV